MKVLLVSNDFDLNVALQILLREEPQCEVIGFVSNAGSANLLIKTDCPDLIILDWDLPLCDANEVLMASQTALCCPEVMVIGKSEADGALALASGAGTFVTKGTSPENLLIAVRRLYANERANLELNIKETNQL